MGDVDLSPEGLAAIKARADAADAGPWIVPGRGWAPTRIEGPELIIYDEGGHTVQDAEFIAAARTDVPALVAEVLRLRAELDDVRATALTVDREAMAYRSVGWLAVDADGERWVTRHPRLHAVEVFVRDQFTTDTTGGGS